jgi:hypothetical protein
MLAEAEYDDNNDYNVENLPELHDDLDYFATLVQTHDQPSTPAGSTNIDEYCQSNDLINGLLFNAEKDNVLIKSGTAHGCFCPANLCNCPRKSGLGEERVESLPQPAFQPKSPAKTMQTTPMTERWNLDEFFAGGDLDTEALNLNWDS